MTGTPPAMTPEKWFDATGAHSKRNVPPRGAAHLYFIGIGPSVNDLACFLYVAVLPSAACGGG